MGRALLALPATVLSALGLVLLAPPPAHACSCADRSTKDQVERADVIVTGTITDVDPPPWYSVVSSGDQATYHVAVDRVLKGDASEPLTFRSAVSGASCGLEGVEAGGEYVVLLDLSEDGLSANLCGGTGDVSAHRVAGLLDSGGDRPEGMPESQVAVIDADVPAQPAVPSWTVTTGLLAGIVAAGAAWVMRRRAARR